MLWWLLPVALLCLAHPCEAHTPRSHPLPMWPGPMDDTDSQHTDNWAVVVSTSRFWHNYRHTANALAVYHMARSSGIPDSHIVLMLADDTGCDPRNPFAASVFVERELTDDLLCGDIEVDYAGDAVTAVTFLRVLTGFLGRDAIGIQSGQHSNVLVYVTGHSGEHFIKFHDYDFLTSYDIADAFDVMNVKGRYHRAFFVIDTCQAETLITHITAPNVLALASSREYENSLSHIKHIVPNLSAALVDGFTGEWYFAFQKLFARVVQQKTNKKLLNISLLDFFDAHIDPVVAQSHHVSNVDRSPAAQRAVRRHWKLADFFGVGVTPHTDPAYQEPLAGWSSTLGD